MTDTSTEASGREALQHPLTLSPDTVTAYRQHGWTRVEQAIPHTVAAALHDEHQRTSSATAPGSARLDGARHNYADDPGFQRQHRLHSNLEKTSELFRSVVFSRRLASVGAQLLGIDRVQHFRSTIFEKQPSSEGGIETGLHQDFPFTPFDRSRSLTIWIALTDLTPEMGPLQFVPESHRFGVVGRDEIYRPDRDYVQRLQHQESFQLTPPAPMRAGDATVHADLTLHGAGPNHGSRPRLGLSVYYMDPDTLYNGAPTPQTADLDMIPNAPFPPDHFPVLGG